MNAQTPDPSKFPNLFIFKNEFDSNRFVEDLTLLFAQNGITKSLIVREGKNVNFEATSDRAFRVQLNSEGCAELIFA